MASANAMRKLQQIAKLKQAMIDAVRHGAIMYCNGQGGRPIVDQHFTAGNQQRYGWQPLSRDYFMWKQGLLQAARPPKLNKAAQHAINAVKFHRQALRKVLLAKRGINRKQAKEYIKKGTGHAEEISGSRRDISRELMEFDLRTKSEIHAITQRVTPKSPERIHVAKGVRLDKNAGFMSKTGELVGFGQGKNLPMLVLTGAMRQSVNSKGHTVTMQGGNAIILFRRLVEYATYHHEGAPPLPERSPVKPNELDRDQVIEHMKAYIRRATGLQPNKRTI